MRKSKTVPVIRSVIIDTDPGIDDAVAILFALASPEFDVRGITTVAGNLGIDVTTRNAGRILALAGRSDIPIAIGAAQPLTRRGSDSAGVHGGDGLGGVAFPEPAALPIGIGAVEWLAAELDRAPAGALDILALGPLTNIALLLRDHPRSAARLGKVIAMGGAIHEKGNAGPRAEFNMATDPEAAAAVFAAGLNFVLIPLDVTRRVRATREETAMLFASSGAAAQASGALIDAYFQSTTGGDSRPLHDPCVMLYALRPDLFGTEKLNLAVDLSDDPGALALDPSGPSVATLMKVDGTGAKALLWQRLTGR
jgi:purine nucleosidase